jgi:hypothetical protein
MAKVLKRSTSKGKGPPQCGRMNVMSGQREIVLDRKRFIAARVVSKRNSNMGLRYCGNAEIRCGAFPPS